MWRNSQMWLNIGIGLLLCLVVVNGIVASRNIRQLHEDAQLVAHTHEVLKVLERTESTVKDAETGQRGYLLTSDTSYLEPYEDALSRSKRELATLESLVAENPRLSSQLPHLRDLILTKLDELAVTVEMGKNGDFSSAVRRVSTDRGKRTMEEIRGVIGDMVSVERELLVERQLADDRAYRSAVLGVVISATAGVGGLLGLFWLIRRQVRALREADRHKDEFLATLAHELRNPIAPISNALQIWSLVDNDPEELSRLRAIMEPQVRQLTRLIDDLLDASRIEQGKIHFRRQPVDLAAIIPSAIDVIRTPTGSCEHGIEVHLANEPLVVDGDAERLRQALENLLQNAAKYTDRGGQIRVSALREGNQAVISIQDTGVGIQRQMLPRIFEMFRQADPSMTRAHGGLGVGLALVKRLVGLHGGSVEAHSEGKDKGSTFIVRLPISESPLAGDAQPDARSLGTYRCDLPQRQILVVDDVPASAKTLAMLLERIGQQVSIVHNGSAAIEYVKTHRPDVVFLDIAMPGMDGYEVARKLRVGSDTSQTVLVALTGYGDVEARRKSTEVGLDHHLTKPISIDQLVELLRELRRPERAEKDSLAD